MKPVLLVEDDENDVFLMERAFAGVRNRVELHVARDGGEALRYLRGEGAFADRVAHPLPQLILLDLKMPFVPGHEVLKQIRRDATLRHLVVVVLTSSAAPADVIEAYAAGANSYLVKPSSLAERDRLVALLTEYWLGLNVMMPKR